MKQVEHNITRNKLRQIFSIVPIICHHQGIHLTELQKISGFPTEKSLREGLERLMFFGIPPFSPSDFITVHIDDRQRVWLDFPLGLERPLALSTAEWTAIQKLLRDELNFISKDDTASQEITQLLGKLSGIPIEFETDELITLQRHIIQEALEDGWQLTFHYRSLSSREAELRRVDPWALFKSHGLSYLIGYCHTRCAARFFLLERMQNLELLDMEQENQSPPDLNDHLASSPLFQKKPKGFSIELAFAPDLLANLRTLFYLERITPWKKAPQGKTHWLKANSKVQDSFWLISTLLGMGKEIILLAPLHLRDKLRTELNQIKIAPCFPLVL